MTESDKTSLEGHKPNLSDLLRDIYELLAFFLASQKIAELDQSRLYGDNDPLQQFGDLQRDLITKRLIAIAITIRILDDRDPHVFDMLTDYCGTITKDLAKPLEREGLSIRDACNKIIHARTVMFDTANTSSGRTYLYPTLYLEGKEWSKPWAVDLDVIKFCRESAASLDLV